MTRFHSALPLAVFAAGAIFTAACLPGGSNRPEPTPTPRAAVQAARTVVPSTATPLVSPTALPVLPPLTRYVVKSGDYPTLIAENAGVPAEERDAWITEMLALNGVEATSLQIGQELILPPYGIGGVTSAVSSTPAAPPAAVVESTQAPAPATNTPAAGNTPFATGGIPVVPTPPFVAFTSPTATATNSPTPTNTPLPTATPTATTIPAGARAWLTSTDDTALHYYCDLDTGWRTIPPEKLIAFDSEQQLLAIWGRYRTKSPNSVC